MSLADLRPGSAIYETNGNGARTRGSGPSARLVLAVGQLVFELLAVDRVDPPAAEDVVGAVARVE